MVNSPPLPHTEKCCPRPLLDTRWRVNEVKPRQGVRKSQIRGAGLASLLHCCRAALLPSRCLPCTGYYCADSKKSGKREKTVSVQLAKRYILCFVDDVCQLVVSAFLNCFAVYCKITQKQYTLMKTAMLTTSTSASASASPSELTSWSERRMAKAVCKNKGDNGARVCACVRLCVFECVCVYTIVWVQLQQNTTEHKLFKMGKLFSLARTTRTTLTTQRWRQARPGLTMQSPAPTPLSASLSNEPSWKIFIVYQTICIN